MHLIKARNERRSMIDIMLVHPLQLETAVCVLTAGSRSGSVMVK